MIPLIVPAPTPAEPVSAADAAARENTEAFLAALAAAMGLVPVGRPQTTTPVTPVAMGGAAAATHGKEAMVPSAAAPLPGGTIQPQAEGQPAAELPGPATEPASPSAEGRIAIPREMVTTPAAPERVARPEVVVPAHTDFGARPGASESASMGPSTPSAAAGTPAPREAETASDQQSSSGQGGARHGTNAPQLAPPANGTQFDSALQRAPSTASEGAAGMTEVDQPEPLPPPQHQARVAMVDANGDRATIRVAVRGETVRTTIVHPDGQVVEDLRAHADDLRRALGDQGLGPSRVKVHSVISGGVIAGGDAGPGTTSEQTQERQAERQRQQADEWSQRREPRDRDQNARSGRDRKEDPR